MKRRDTGRWGDAVRVLWFLAWTWSLAASPTASATAPAGNVSQSMADLADGLESWSVGERHVYAMRTELPTTTGITSALRVELVSADSEGRLFRLWVSHLRAPGWGRELSSFDQPVAVWVHADGTVEIRGPTTWHPSLAALRDSWPPAFARWCLQAAVRGLFLASDEREVTPDSAGFAETMTFTSPEGARTELRRERRVLAGSNADVAASPPELQIEKMPRYEPDGHPTCPVKSGQAGWEALVACDPASAWRVLLPRAVAMDDYEAVAAAVRTDAQRALANLDHRMLMRHIWARCDRVPAELFEQAYDEHVRYHTFLRDSALCTGSPGVTALRLRALRELATDVPRAVKTRALHAAQDVFPEPRELAGELFLQRHRTHGIDRVSMDLLHIAIGSVYTEGRVARAAQLVSQLPDEDRASLALSHRWGDLGVESWLAPSERWTEVRRCRHLAEDLAHAPEERLANAWFALRECDRDVHDHALLFAVVQLHPGALELALEAGDLPLASEIVGPQGDVDCDSHPELLEFRKRAGMAWGDIERMPDRHGPLGITCRK